MTNTTDMMETEQFNDTIELTDGLSTKLQRAAGWEIWICLNSKPLAQLAHNFDDEIYDDSDPEDVIFRKIADWHREMTGVWVEEISGDDTKTVALLMQRAQMLAAGRGCRVGAGRSHKHESVAILTPGTLREYSMVSLSHNSQMATIRVWAAAVTKLEAEDYSAHTLEPWIFGETS